MGINDIDDFENLSVHVECPKCDSVFRIDWDPEYSSEPEPKHCAFCGEKIEYIATEDVSPFDVANGNEED
jgi:hypothetical protein